MDRERKNWINDERKRGVLASDHTSIQQTPKIPKNENNSPPKLSKDEFRITFDNNRLLIEKSIRSKKKVNDSDSVPDHSCRSYATGLPPVLRMY